LEDALRREEEISPATADQRSGLANSMKQFWDSSDRIFSLAQGGQETQARTFIRDSLQSRQAALTAAVARLLVQNNDREQRASAQTEEIYAHVERNAYIFLAAMLALVAATSLYLVQYNRRMFARTAALAERRSELARQLMTMQEDTFRYISRELHDEFGQILTAIGAMLQGTTRRAASLDASVRTDLQEVREIVQSTLERIRALSQSLHPAVLDDAGLEGALHAYLPGFEKQTGVEIRYEKQGDGRPVDGDAATQIYRVLQEALNNVVRHSKATRAAVRLRYLPDSIVLEVEDDGVGFQQPGASQGLGVTSMRERAELVQGRLELLRGESGGALVRLTVPLAAKEAHAEA
ncbi:MAG TPA: sensor histidine kinase, partial [Bryobacteraceae bacterium]